MDQFYQEGCCVARHGRDGCRHPRQKLGTVKSASGSGRDGVEMQFEYIGARHWSTGYSKRHQWRRPSTQLPNAHAGSKPEQDNMSLSENVRTQARLRARLGVPVCLAMLLCIWQWGTAAPFIGAAHVVSAFGLNLIYNVAVLIAVR